MSTQPLSPPKRPITKVFKDLVIWWAYFFRAWLRKFIGKDKCSPPVRTIWHGSLRRVTPVSTQYGVERGLPIDRYYVESYLEEESDSVFGRVLESGSSSYSQRFGKGKVEQYDVINLKEGSPHTTFRADLANAPQIPSDIFDCVILAQTFQFIYDTKAALETVHRILKPGGTLLATFSGLSQTSDAEWREYWYWNFTSLSARTLFSETFGEENIELKTYGNVLSATSFMYGLCTKELREDELDFHDPNYEVTIAVKATKPR